jgi:soluble lytic murein transglycosylase-like protein
LAQVLALAAQLGGGASPVVIAGIATHESALHTKVVGYNRNGSHDSGLMQINSSNFATYHVNDQTILDPATNIKTGAAIWNQSWSLAQKQVYRTALSYYATGTPDKGFKLHAPGDPLTYVDSMDKVIQATAAKAGQPLPLSSVEIPVSPCEAHADMWVRQKCFNDEKAKDKPQ